MFVSKVKYNLSSPSFGRRKSHKDFFLERRLKRQKASFVQEALAAQTKRMQQQKLPYDLIVRYKRNVLNSIK